MLFCSFISVTLHSTKVNIKHPLFIQVIYIIEVRGATRSAILQALVRYIKRLYHNKVMDQKPRPLADHTCLFR